MSKPTQALGRAVHLLWLLLAIIVASPGSFAAVDREAAALAFTGPASDLDTPDSSIDRHPAPGTAQSGDEDGDAPDDAPLANSAVANMPPSLGDDPFPVTVGPRLPARVATGYLARAPPLA